MATSEVVIVDAVRSPIGKRNGELSTMHSINLLGDVQKAVFDRTGMDPAEVGQVVGGCVGQVGMQAMNTARNAWLAAELPLSVAATTVDAQCGSSQQATNLAYSLVRSGVVEVALSCGVELMSRVKMGATIPDPATTGVPVNSRYWKSYEWTSQFEGAERIADKWDLTRAEADEFGLRSQQLAARAWEEDAFGSQIVPIEVPVLDDDGEPTGEHSTVSRDGGLRETSIEALASLKPVARDDGIHTAGSSSQISDGAGAVLMMTRSKADELGLEPLAMIVDACLVGTDPVLMLTGPIDATQKLLSDNNLEIDDVGLIEINEAFASVVLAWERELSADMGTVNPNGGAIALGHPLGGTGSILIAKAVHEMQRRNIEHGIVTMCCGGGLGTGTLLRKV